MKKHKSLLILTLALALAFLLCSCQSKSQEAEEQLEINQSTSEIETSSGTDLSNVGTGSVYTDSSDSSHAVIADGETIAYDNISVSKTGDASGDEADFYGTNAAVFATNGANLTLTNSKIVTAGSHANAVFSYGEGTELTISDSVIETSENNSGGIMVTGGGTLNASNLLVTTQGGSSAAIRSDRGGGTMIVTGGSYSSFGSGSPAIYSTADVTVSDATLYSGVSQAVVVEGKNSVTLVNVNATGNNTKKNSNNSDQYQAVMIYQSMSGDASVGKGVFTMTGGSLTSLNGGMFFVNNTVAEINLSSVEFVYATDDFLRIEAAGWGTSGSNGGHVTLNASSQQFEGVITVDNISDLNLYLKDGSVFTGSIDNEGETYIEIEDGSKWVLTGDSEVTGLTCSADAIDLNGYTLTVNGNIYAEGTESMGTAIVQSSAAESHSTGQAPSKPGNH